MSRLRHSGVPSPLRTLTQVTLLIRLAALGAGLVVFSGSEIRLVTTIGFLVVGGTSFLWLMNTSTLDLVRRHPSIAMLDALLLAGIVALNGLDSPLLLAALTTALLLGLWLEPVGGAIVMLCLVVLYVGATVLHSDRSTCFTFVSLVAMPFMYISLWLLGLTFRRSVGSEAAAQLALRDAVATAAAVETRNSLARELHDSLAKSVQGIALTATALHSQIERSPAKAIESAGLIREMAATAVFQLRGVMTDLRARMSDVTLAQAVTQVVLGWATRTGRDPILAIEDAADADDEATRYELLASLEEALDNVHRHAGRCRVEVKLEAGSDALTLEVRDDGVGVGPEQLADAARAGHHGVTGMSERLARVGGWCTIVRGDPTGTVVKFYVPKLDRIER